MESRVIYQQSELRRCQTVGPIAKAEICTRPSRRRVIVLFRRNMLATSVDGRVEELFFPDHYHNVLLDFYFTIKQYTGARAGFRSATAHTCDGAQVMSTIMSCARSPATIWRILPWIKLPGESIFPSTLCF